MEEAVTTFPFRKLRLYTYLIVDVMMCIEKSKALEFIFCVNKEARKFIQHNLIKIQNGFINEGLIVYDLHYE